MKIGILTFHYAHNYGAVLQAYSLKTYLESLGHDVRIIDYRNHNIAREYPKKLKMITRKKYILNPLNWKEAIRSIEKWYYSKKSWSIQFLRFENFINRYLLNGELNDWRDDIKKCQLIFFGSDQIWEDNLIGEHEKIYFGCFDTSAIKATYAASCYDAKIFSKSKKIQFLSNFDYLSTREETLAKVIKNVFPEKEIKTVVDPVFLLSQNDFRSISFREKEINHEYILFYYVTENSELSRISHYLRETENKKVIEIHYSKMKGYNDNWQLTDVGPLEFLDLFSNAKMIITNSFHGTAFSLIFKKTFWTLSNNVRIVDALSRFGLQSRRIDSFSDWIQKKEEEINYDEFGAKMTKYVKKSKDYIQKILNEVQK